MKFCERIKQARTKASLRQSEVSECFLKFGYSVKPYVISSWEIGKHKPDIEQFSILCKIYKADGMLLLTGKNSSNQDSILNGLNEKGRSQVLNYIDLLKSNAIFTEEENVIEMKTIRLYNTPVSAGAGVYLDSDDYETTTFDDQVPCGTDYAVRVSGDSMEPIFHSGQILFIKEQQTLNNGEIGIFALNGEAFVKQMLNGKLISINSKYKPIKLRESDEFRVFGKVIGTSELCN